MCCCSYCRYQASSAATAAALAGLHSSCSSNCCAAYNLHARLSYDLGEQRELLDLPKVGPSVKERREDEVAALRAVTGRLEASLLELDHQLCIFADV